MPSRNNPRNLNPLQLRTLAVFQRLASIDRHVARRDEDGSVTLWNLPHPHGDHFHLGDAVIRTRDASGLFNPSAWAALQRKGLIDGEFPERVSLTPEALAYQAGDIGSLAEHSDH